MAIHLEYPSDIGIDGTNFDGVTNIMQFSIYDRKDVEKSELISNIYLYMPLDVQNTTSASWEQGSIGAAGFALNKGLNNGDAIGNTYTGLTSAFLRSIEQLKQTVQGTTSGGIGAGQNAGEFIQKKIINPYIKVLFKGVDYRNFTYSFIFTPHNEKKTETIHSIIKSFRSATVPRKSEFKLFMEYPNELEIEFYTIIDGVMVENRWINKIKRVVLTDVTVNHTATGNFATMRNGFGSHTQLDLSFTENELIYRDDIEEGGY